MSVFQFHRCLVLRTFRQQDWFFFLSSPNFFFLGIACCFRSVLLSISEWRFKGHQQAAALLLHNSSVVQCQKIILPNFPTTGCIKNAREKKLIMPDTLRIRCTTSWYVFTLEPKACLKSYLTYYIIWRILSVLVKFISQFYIQLLY